MMGRDFDTIPLGRLIRPDPELLSTLLACPHPLVTLDRRIAFDHVSSIPESHPSVVIVSHETSLANSIIEITPSAIEVWHVAGGQLARDGYLLLSAADWSSRLSEMLRVNARRT